MTFGLIIAESGIKYKTAMKTDKHNEKYINVLRVGETCPGIYNLATIPS